MSEPILHRSLRQAFVLPVLVFFLTLAVWHLCWIELKVNNRFKAEWPMGLAEQSLTAQHSTRPLVLLQAISRHSCQTRIALAESRSQQDHLAHIALSEPMTN